MQRLRLVLFLTFWLTVAAILVGRGAYFYVQNQFDFSDVARLWMAVGYGLIYVPGALLSHRMVVAWQEKRTLLLMVIGLALTMALAATGADRPLIVVAGFIAS